MERADRPPVGTFHAPGTWAGVVALDDAAAHHAQVKRLRAGDPVRLTSGDGRVATGLLDVVEKRRLTVALDPSSVMHVPAPRGVALLAPVGDRDRMLLLAEKCVELGLSAWHPVVYQRSRSVSPRGEGEAFREKVRLRMVSALEQSGGAWLPVLHAECSPEAARDAVRGAIGLLLDGSGEPVAGAALVGGATIAIALGPEGGLEPGERDAFIRAGWRATSLGNNVLRFETAGIAALAIVRACLS